MKTKFVLHCALFVCGLLLSCIFYQLAYSSPPEPPALLITEVLPNPVGTEDDRREWLEIYNNSDTEITVTDLTISDNYTSDTIATMVLPARSFHVIATSYDGLPGVATETITIISDGRIGNGLANSKDMLHLHDEYGQEIDAVYWGAASPDPSQNSPAPAEGHSLQRVPHDIDTNLGTDFVELAEPTPGTAYEEPTTDTIGNAHDILFTEVYPDPQATPESDYEWFELLNTTNVNYALRGWYITDNTSSVILPEIHFSAGETIIVAASAAAMTGYDTGATQVFILDAAIGGGLGNSGDRLLLTDSAGTVIDALSWGSDTTIFNPSSLPPATDLSLQRYPHDQDTDCADDFLIALTTPGQAHIPAPPVIYSDAIQINEILPAPGSTHDWNADGTADGYDEFIELSNTSGVNIDLTGWTLDDIPDGGSKPFVISATAVLPGNGYAVFFRQHTEESYTSSITLNNDEDCVYLYAPDAVIKDSYCFDEVETDVAYARDPSDASWSTTDQPTPGQVNTLSHTDETLEDPEETFSDEIKLSEIMAAPAEQDWDGNGTADGYDEWIELYNQSSQAIDLTGWILDDTVDTGSAPHILSTFNLAPHAYAVFYRQDAAEQEGTHLTLNNDEDCVNLSSPDGEVKDMICYEDMKKSHKVLVPVKDRPTK
ncbi:MAG TPA: lamin tail domain-containing protein, partial [bacterium]|nr:lamin tail domain-containing protein [bacterium]